VCTEAVAVVRAVGADFFLDRWHVEIASDNSSIYVYIYIYIYIYIQVYRTLD
jgi:hypothetical protein